MSNFFGPALNRPVQGVYAQLILLMPSCLAIAVARSTSYPRGFVMVLPRTVPLLKPTAGSPKATVSSPDFMVGALPALAAPAQASAAVPTAVATRNFFMLADPPVLNG